MEISSAKSAGTITLLVQIEKKKEGEKTGDAKEVKEEKKEPTTKSFPAGSYVIRMDQPYSRIADALLDHQYWSPEDPQKTPYDDTGWTFGELFGVQVVRVTDAKILDAPMEKVSDVRAPGGVKGDGGIFAINNHAEPALATLRYKLKDATIEAAEEAFDTSGTKFARGTFLIRDAKRAEVENAAKELGLQAVALGAAPGVKTHPIRAARIAYIHTWLSTQTEGWWRLALDSMQIPYDYMSTQAIAKIPDLRAKYDVILFPPVGFNASANAIIQGLPTAWGNPLPWQNTPLTPNLVGKNDSTDDMRPGLGLDGVAKLQSFVEKGGVLLTADDTAQFALSIGMGVAGGRRRRHLGPDMRQRPTGRGTKDEPDYAVGRSGMEAPEEPESEIWEYPPVTDEQKHNNARVIPLANRARVVLRYANTKDLLISGLVDGGGDIAQHPAVLDVPFGQGHVVLFSINPVYRGETRGTYSLVLNTVLNFDSLNAGRKDAAK